MRQAEVTGLSGERENHTRWGEKVRRRDIVAVTNGYGWLDDRGSTAKKFGSKHTWRFSAAGRRMEAQPPPRRSPSAGLCTILAARTSRTSCW